MSPQQPPPPPPAPAAEQGPSNNSNGTSAAAAAAAAAADRPIRRRVRTGCLKCRSRRRKCDERKPVCTNCAERGFDCQYGLQLRFPASNARTIPKGAVETPASAVQYTQIRFADDPVEDEETRRSERSSTTATTTVGGRRPSDTSHAGGASDNQASRSLPTPSLDKQNAADRRKDDESTVAAAPIGGMLLDVGHGEQERQTLDYAITGHAHDHHHHHHHNPFHFDNDLDGTRHHEPRHLQAGSADEHGAIQSLVSMATSTQQHALLFDDDDSLGHGPPIPGPESDHHSLHDAAAAIAPTPGSTSALTNDTLAHAAHSPVDYSNDNNSEERALSLLRYYRYHVAPWLDMLDQTHALGIQLPTIGAESPAIHSALLALSARHSELASGIPAEESAKYYRMSKAGPWGHAILHADVASPDVLEARIIRLVVDLISSPLGTWPAQLEHSTALFAPLYPYALDDGGGGTSGSLATALFRCCFRFDLAGALANETVTVMDVDAFLQRDDAGLMDGSSGALFDQQSVDAVALRVLFLCGRAVRISQEHRQREVADERGEQQQRPRPRNHVLQWQGIWTELSAWYKSRHKFVGPLLELSLPTMALEDDGAAASVAFPTIIFTTAAATLANLLYHTAAMIVLDCKPKTLKVPGHSPAVSQHWHAQRICAIAVSHASFESWDPCMAACVLHAARKMTHREQQTAVLETLRHCRDATGWKIDDNLQALEQFWRLAEHS